MLIQRCLKRAAKNGEQTIKEYMKVAGSNRYEWRLYVCQANSLITLITSLNPRNVRLSATCKLNDSRISRAKWNRDGTEETERKMEETMSEVSNHDNWPSFALFRFLRADTVGPHSWMFRIDVIRQFRVKVGGRSRFLPHANCARFHPPLLASIFLAPGGGNGKPSKYLSASISTLACQVEENRFERDGKYNDGAGETETSRAAERRQRVWVFFPKTVSSPVRFRKATAEGT